DPSSSSAYYNDVNACPSGVHQSPALDNTNISQGDQINNLHANLQTNELQGQFLVGPLLLTVKLQLLTSDVDPTSPQTFPQLPGPINITISEDHQCLVYSQYTTSQTQLDQSS
ncbi:25974_t:CDS:2, partial [Dentiscutata erythropus]